jgi:hypothetical protein
VKEDVMKNSAQGLRRGSHGSLAIAVALVFCSSAFAATTFGVRTGVYTDQTAGFVGGEVLTPIAQNWSFNPNLEVAMADSRDVVAVSGDFHYDFFQDRPYWVWAGGGPAVIHREFDDDSDDTALGVNVLGGIAWRTSTKVSPYVQVRSRSRTTMRLCWRSV